MKQTGRIVQKLLAIGLVLMLATVVVAACGGDEEESEPTPTNPSPTATVAPTATLEPADTPVATPESAAQPESPLPQPESPLPQPESPLASPSSQDGPAVASRTIDMSVPIDPEFLAELAESAVSDEPSPGSASISGLLYSYNIDNVIPGTQFYLTPADEHEGKLTPPVIYLGPRPEEGDFLGFSNEFGQVSLTDVTPGNYYMAVWTVYDWLLATTSEEETWPLLIALEPDQKLDLGVLYVNWP